MEEAALYEKIRVILGTGHNEIAAGNAFALPRHEATFKKLSNLFCEKEARIIVDGFQQAPSGIYLMEHRSIGQGWS